MKQNKDGFVLGVTNTRYVYVVNQNAPYIQSEYLIIEDDSSDRNLVCEVIETSILPFANDKILPEGCITEFLTHCELDIKKQLFLAKVKILQEIPFPVMPFSRVRNSVFEEIRGIITKAKPDDCMSVGIIKGTELSQDELPSELQDIAPLWEEGKAILQKGVPLMINHHSLREYPHIGLFGSSGSGKSFALRVLCEELMKLEIPGLCFDPHYELKFEGLMEGLPEKYRFNYKDRYEEFVIGENVGIKFEDLTSGELISLFDFIDPLSEPQKNTVEVMFRKGDSFRTFQEHIQALKEILEKVEMKGKSNVIKLIESNSDGITPLQSEMYSKYGSKVSGATSLQALLWKCISLENTHIFTGNILGVKSAIKKRKFAIVRGDIMRLQMISSYLINKLYKARRKYIDEKDEFFPPFFIIVDEAHNFAPEGTKSTPTKSVLKKIGQEARKYGVFLIPCTQRPRSLDSTLLAQLNTKFIFRLTDQNDMQVAKVEGNLTDSEVSRLPDLQSGNCFVSSAILNKTYPVRFRTTFSKAPNVKDPFKELNELTYTIENKLEETLIEFLPLTTLKIGRKIKDIRDEYLKKVGSDTNILNIDISSVMECLNDMTKKNLITISKEAGMVKYDKI